MDNYNYPLGADTEDAPWNEVEVPEEEIEVTVSVTLSKTVKIKVTDYTVESGTDEEGEHFKDIDYSSCDLKKAVEEQITLPQYGYLYIRGDHENGKLIEDLSGWNVDDYEVILE